MIGSSYFFQLSKRNYNIKNITKLEKDNGEIITSPCDIKKLQLEFYSSLYSKKECSDHLDDFFFSSLPKLSEEQQHMLSQEITLDELSNAVKMLKNGKTPGTDGLTTDFYKCFWNDIKQIVFDSLKEGYVNKILSAEQRRSVLQLLPKKGKD